MAEVGPRSISIVDALLNTTSTQSQRDRISKAFAAALPPEATQTEIAEQFLKELWQVVVDRVMTYETQAAIIAVRESKISTIPTDFAQLP